MHQPGRVTLLDVARAAGVSRATASRVVRGDTNVAKKKTRAVQAAVEKLGYVPHSAARALATHRTGTIVIIIPEPDERVFADPFFAQTVHSISQAVDELGMQLVMAFSGHPGDGRRTAGFLYTGAVDGAVIISHHREDGQVEAFLNAPVPVVFIGRPRAEFAPGPWVDTDNTQGGRLAARHLLKAGAHAPAIITGPTDMIAAVDRLAGFREELGKAGIEPVVVEGDYTAESGGRAGNDLAPHIARGTVDAVFCSSDLMTMSAIEAWRSQGISVPDDVMVVSYDDTPAGAAFSPALTSVSNPPRELGRAATLMLRDILEGTWDGNSLVLPVRLVERESA